MSLLISCIISSQVDANPKKGAERDFSFERPHERRRHGSSSLFVFYFPWRLAVVLRARFQSPATPNTTQRSNARRVRSFRHNFTKEKEDKCRKFHFNRKTYRRFWKLKLFVLSMSWEWSNCYAQVLPAWNSVCRDMFCIVFIRTSRS